MLSNPVIPAPAWLALATAGWYLASRTICGPVASGINRWTAVGLSLPFATTCLAALMMRHPEVAIGATLAGSVAALTLVLGLVGITQPLFNLTGSTKAWAFLLPTSLIVLLIGFSGEIRLSHAVVLLIQGAAVTLGSGMTKPVTKRPSQKRLSPIRAAVNVVAVLAMFVASLLAVYAADAISHDLQQPGSGLIASVMLAPALVLPMIGLTTRLAGERRGEEAIGLIVKVVLINLCLWLPMSAAVWIAQPAINLSPLVRSLSATTMPASQPTTQSVEQFSEIVRFAFPISVWRIDTVLLIVAGIFLWLLALGRIRLGRIEATAMIFVYVAYLMLTAVAAR